MIDQLYTDYEDAVDDGFIGSFEQYVDGRKGDKGEPGQDGKDFDPKEVKAEVDAGVTDYISGFLSIPIASTVTNLLNQYVKSGKATGPKGLDGLHGADGFDGKDGKPGKDGRNGIDGKQGLNGKDGLNGRDGLMGLKGDKGDRGDDGRSAYQVWLDEGHEGNEQDFLKDIADKVATDYRVEITGRTGSNGKSAYQIAVDNGFVGTEQQWLASLKGSGSGGGSPGGSNTQFQYNNNGVFAGGPLTTDGTNVAASGSISALGGYDEAITVKGIYLGQSAGVSGTPRIGFFNGTAAQNWQVDNDTGRFRWYLPGVEHMVLTTTSLDIFTKYIHQAPIAVPATPANGGAWYVGSDNLPHFKSANGTDYTLTGSGSGSVTSVSVTTANGVSGTVTNPTTTPAISLALGDITPSSVAATGAVTGSNLSGTNTGDKPSAGTNNQVQVGDGAGGFKALPITGVTVNNTLRMTYSTTNGVIFQNGSANTLTLTGDNIVQVEKALNVKGYEYFFPVTAPTNPGTGAYLYQDSGTGHLTAQVNGITKDLMVNGFPTPYYFEGFGNTAIVNTGFQKLNITTITSDAQNCFSTSDSSYTIPVDGLYEAYMAVRVADSAPYPTNYGLGVDTALRDTSTLSWHTTQSGTAGGTNPGDNTPRNGANNKRIFTATAGQKYFAQAYWDRGTTQPFTLNLQIRRIG